MTQVEFPRIFVHTHPGSIPSDALRGGIAIVVDVLRATTSMAHALAAGCREIIPCAEVEEARTVATCVPRGTVLLAGEREGLPIEGFDLGNSPEEFTPEVCRDRTIVMTTSNGTRAILSSLEAEHVFVAAFVNLAATVEEVLVLLSKRDRRHAIHLICAGSDDKPTQEDILFAGCMADRLARKSYELLALDGAQEEIDAMAVGKLKGQEAYEWFVFGSDDPRNETNAVVDDWRQAKWVFRNRPLAEQLQATDGGRRLLEIGRVVDIVAAAQVDSQRVVGKLGRRPTRISAV